MPDTAAAQQTTAIATRPPTNFEIELANYEPQFAAVLPDHIPVERFRRVIITAVNQTPDLIKADRRSLFTACVRAAQDGLYPDGREAALVMFGTAATYMPMIHGIRKRMRNSGEVDDAQAHVVCENDAFDYELGDTPFIKHKPALGERGKPIAAYAIIKLKNGEIIREVMSVPEIEKVRAVSRAKSNGPWVAWWSEMARKTVLRRASKAAPASAEIDTLMRRDDELLGTDDPRVSLPPAPPRPTRAAMHVVEHQAPEETPEHDPVTGEVHQRPADDQPDLPGDVALEVANEVAPTPLPSVAFTGDADAFDHGYALAIQATPPERIDELHDAHQAAFTALWKAGAKQQHARLRALEADRKAGRVA